MPKPKSIVRSILAKSTKRAGKVVPVHVGNSRSTRGIELVPYTLVENPKFGRLEVAPDRVTSCNCYWATHFNLKHYKLV